eukprot:CAMPEP_0169285624 /NCGR_PEP_ID=MMETSP1016-20121227/58807_1 /TAXON_ID=342587 /ORGANISM="Karlodinium micrum, Strain CCMP2283" /LENGTH=350 /DNA_ID=CAMNT_0009375163 /DNA_START=1 /DNA_END=1051 /DNA_ORIENTATION=-
MPKIDTELQASAQDVAHTPALSEAGTLAYTPTPGTAQGRTSMESKDLSPFDSTECTPGPHGNELTPTTPTRTDVEEESHIAPDTQTPFSHSQTVESIDVNHLSRGEQISALFKVLDTEHVGRLKENPMYVLAKALDYEDDEEVFAEYYKQTCESYSVDPDEGFDEEELAALLEEEDGEWFTHEDDIPSVMKTLQGGGGGGGGDRRTPAIVPARPLSAGSTPGKLLGGGGAAKPLSEGPVLTAGRPPGGGGTPEKPLDLLDEDALVAPGKLDGGKGVDKESEDATEGADGSPMGGGGAPRLALPRPTLEDDAGGYRQYLSRQRHCWHPALQGDRLVAAGQLQEESSEAVAP